MYQLILFNHDKIKTSCLQFQNMLSQNLHHFASRTPVNQKLIVHKLIFFLLTMAAERGDNDPGLVDFRGPSGSPWSLGGPWAWRAPWEGPLGFIGPIEMEKTEDLFFFFGDHLKIRRKLSHFAAKTFFLFLVFGNQLKSRENCAIFLASFGLHKTREVQYFSCPRAHPWLSAPPAYDEPTCYGN